MARQWLGSSIHHSPVSYKNFIEHHCEGAIIAMDITPDRVNYWLRCDSHLAVLRRNTRMGSFRHRQAWILDEYCSSEWYLEWANARARIAFELKWA